jgi:short-subunit dehydrogenase
VTGASSGIGEAFANVFAAEGFDLVLTARRADRLNALAERLRAQHGCRVEVIVEDLSDPFAPVRICASLEARLVLVDVLVNNAGYGVPGAYMASPWERHGAMLQVMVVALAELTHRLLPGMIARGYGRIINVSSLAALVPAPAGHTAYAASKAFVVKFSESLAGEVAKHGIHVTALCPGFTLSEFHDVTGTRHTVRQLPPWMWMDAAAVAREGYDAVMSGTPIHVTGRINRLIGFFGRVLPQPLLVAIGRRTAWRYRKA